MWKYEFSKEATKFLEKAEKRLRDPLLGKIRNVGNWLEGKAALRADLKKLRGEGEGFYRNRIRHGSVRIILSIDSQEKVIRVHDRGYRGDVYKK